MSSADIRRRRIDYHGMGLHRMITRPHMSKVPKGSLKFHTPGSSGVYRPVNATSFVARHHEATPCHTHPSRGPRSIVTCAPREMTSARLLACASRVYVRLLVMKSEVAEHGVVRDPAARQPVYAFGMVAHESSRFAFMFGCLRDLRKLIVWLILVLGSIMRKKIRDALGWREDLFPPLTRDAATRARARVAPAGRRAGRAPAPFRRPKPTMSRCAMGYVGDI